MRFIAIADDFNFAPVKAVRALSDFYLNADKEYHLIDPSKLNSPSIGHFGFFRRANQDMLWGDTLDWLNNA